MAMERELGTLIRLLNPYADTMHITDDDPPSAQVVQQAREAPAEQSVHDNICKILVEMETREVEYLSWQFKDLPRRVKRALRIEYRHPIRDKKDPTKILCWVTDHLLVGYEGSN